MNTESKRVVIYARYSSAAQHETSIEGQLKVCYNYCNQHGYTVIHEYIDRAMSGTNDNRPEFQKMISDSANKAFDYVIVYQLDRFARNRYDSAVHKSKLKKNGVRVLSAVENISDDPSGILMESMLEGMAEYFSAELSLKVKRGMRINAEKCLYNGGSLTLGYRINENKEYEIDPNTAKIIEYIFKEYSKGQTIKSICDTLNSQGYKTIRNKSYTTSSIQKVLRNKRYIGVFTYNDMEIPNGIPRIISDELFQKVQLRLKENKKAPARAKAMEKYLLTGKLFCGHCKNPMSGYSGTSRNGSKHTYYVCNGRKKKLCNKKNVSKDIIEEMVIDKCRELLNDETIDKLVGHFISIADKEYAVSETARLEAKILDLDKQINNLTMTIANCSLPIAQQKLCEQLEELSKSKISAEEQLAEQKLVQHQVSADTVRQFLLLLRSGNYDSEQTRTALVTVLINKIYLYDDHMVLIFNTGHGEEELDVSALDWIESQTDSGSFLSSFGTPERYKTNQILFLNKSIVLIHWFD